MGLEEKLKGVRRLAIVNAVMNFFDLIYETGGKLYNGIKSLVMLPWTAATYPWEAIKDTGRTLETAAYTAAVGLDPFSYFAKEAGYKTDDYFGPQMEQRMQKTLEDKENAWTRKLGTYVGAAGFVGAAVGLTYVAAAYLALGPLAPAVLPAVWGCMYAGQRLNYGAPKEEKKEEEMPDNKINFEEAARRMAQQQAAQQAQKKAA